MPRPPRSSAQRGSTMIEFLFIVITLLIVMFGGIEADRMMMVYTNLNDAAKAGARYAIVHGSTRTSGSVSAGDYSAVTSLVKGYVMGSTSTTWGLKSGMPTGTTTSGAGFRSLCGTNMTRG